MMLGEYPGRENSRALNEKKKKKKSILSPPVSDSMAGSNACYFLSAWDVLSETQRHTEFHCPDHFSGLREGKGNSKPSVH